MKRSIFSVLSASIFLLLTLTEGCIPSKPTEDVEILPSERLTNKLEANRRRIKNFEGTGSIQMKTNEFDNSATFRVVLQKPDSLYLEVLGPFGIELAQVLITDEEFMFYDALQNTVYTGVPDDNILEHIFKIDLTFSDLMDAFVGSVNLTSHLYKPPASYNVDFDQYVLTYLDSAREVKTEYRIDIVELGITDYKMTTFSGNTKLVGKYSRFEIMENIAIPYKIEVTNVEENQKVIIDYRQISVNENNIFIDLSIPDDATSISF